MGSKNQYSGIDDYAVEVITYRAKTLVGVYGYKWDDVEDIEQDLMLDLIERMSQFDETKAKLTTFIDRVVDRKISKLIRDRLAKKRYLSKPLMRLDQYVATKGGGCEMILETINCDEYFDRMGYQNRTDQDRLEQQIDIEHTIQQLPPEDQRIVRLLMEIPIAEAARVLKMPRMTLYYRVEKIRKALIELGLDKNWSRDSSFLPSSGYVSEGRTNH